jgi:hypothetical protein
MKAADQADTAISDGAVHRRDEKYSGPASMTNRR